MPLGMCEPKVSYPLLSEIYKFILGCKTKNMPMLHYFQYQFVICEYVLFQSQDIKLFNPEKAP